MMVMLVVYWILDDHHNHNNSYNNDNNDNNDNTIPANMSI